MHLLALLLLSQFTPPPGVSPSGGTYVTSEQIQTSGPLSLCVDQAMGNDNPTCACGTSPCATIQAACNVVPYFISAPGVITVDAGVFAGGGCSFSGHQFIGAGSMLIQGTLLDAPDAGSGCVSTGTVASATQLSNNNFPTLTFGTGCWADAGLRGYAVEITAGTGAGDILQVYDNTLNVVTLAGQWPVTPAGGATFHIRVPGTILDGGVTLPGSTATKYAVTSGIAAAQTNYAAFILGSNGTVNLAPNWWPVNAANAPNMSGGISIEKFGYGPGFTGNMVSGRGTSGIVVAYNWTNFQSDTTGSALYQGDSSSTLLISNYSTQGGSSLGVFLGVDPYGVASFVGNVSDGTPFVASSGTPQTGNFQPTIVSSYVSLANSVRNISGQAFLGNPHSADFRADKVEVTTSGAACMKLGQGFMATAGGPAMTATHGRIRGGIYTGCSGSAFQLGGVWEINGGGSLVTSGNSGAYGILAMPGAIVDITASSATVTGTSGDLSLDNANAIPYTTLTTMKTLSDPTTQNRFSLGANAHGQVRYGVITDTSGTPGNGTANVICGRSAIASAASAAIITNYLSTTTSIVKCQLETSGAGVGAVVCAPGSGNFTATSVNGTGVATVTSSTATFNWCVNN